MYEQNLNMDVQDGDQSTAPLTQGRPRKQQVHAGEARIRNSTCGTCGEAGYNARSCRRPHM